MTDDITRPDGKATSDARRAFDAIDWDARLRDAVTKTLEARDRRRNERAEFQRRRDFGKARYHAFRLARDRGTTSPSVEGTENQNSTDERSEK